MSDKSPEWLLAHATTIGGSTAAAALGRSKYLSRRALYDRFRFTFETGEPPPPVPENDHMRRGKGAEPSAIAALAKYLNRYVHPHDQNEILYHRDRPYAHCVPDAWVPSLPDAVVEVKCPHPATISRVMREGLEDDWFCQAQHNMAVTGKDRCIFWLFNVMTWQGELLEVPAIKTVACEILDGEAEFVEMVRTGTPPEEDTVLARRDEDVSNDDLLLLEHDDEAIEVGTGLLRLREIRERCDEEIDRMQEWLLYRGHGKRRIEVPGLVRLTTSESAGRRTFDHKAAVAKFPELANPVYWKQGKPYSTTRVYDRRACLPGPEDCE